ncbi:MAG: GldM family protein [Saprospiraceae bacterium]
MKFPFFYQKKNLCLYFLLIIMWGCAVPMPIAEQNFNKTIVGVEYDVFDLAAESIFIYQKEKKKKNEAFLLSLKKNADKKNESEIWYESAKSVNEIGVELTNKVEDIWNQIVSQSGGKDTKGHPLGADQKIVAKEILFEEMQAYELQAKIINVKKRWLELIPSQDRSLIENALPDFFNQEKWVSEKTKNLQIGVLQLTFAHLTFGIEKAKEEMLIYFWEKINSPPIVFDRLQVMANPQKSFIKKGENYEADIYLSSILNPFGDDNMTAIINGQTFPFRDGVAKYKVAANSMGDKKYNVQIKVKDPLTDEERSYEKPFEYKVGEDAIQITASKMNVLYIGVDNPVSILAAGISPKDLKVSVSGGGNGKIRKSGGLNEYVVHVNKPTTYGNGLKITVEANGISVTEIFRVKRIPDPVAQLGKSQGGAMGVGEFRAQAGVPAILHNFDFDAKCQIQGYILTRIPRNEARVEVVNRGARYTRDAKELIKQALPGDIYTFDKMKVRCPGDPAGRLINSMVFKIK